MACTYFSTTGLPRVCEFEEHITCLSQSASLGSASQKSCAPFLMSGLYSTEQSLVSQIRDAMVFSTTVGLSRAGNALE